MLVEVDADLAVALRQAVGLEGSRDRATGVAVVEQDDAATVVVDDQAALDALRERLMALQGDYLVSDGLADYADGVARLRTRLPRVWQGGIHSVAA
jgi:hypothetical protein